MQDARRGCCHLLHPLKQEVFWDAQIAATVQVFGRQSRHEQPFRKEADASCEARLLPYAAHFEAGRVFRDAQIATTVHVFGRLHRHDSACKEADASCEARLLPSVAPFEAGSVWGCTDSSNRAGAEKAASSCSAFPQGS